VPGGEQDGYKKRGRGPVCLIGGRGINLPYKQMRVTAGRKGKGKQHEQLRVPRIVTKGDIMGGSGRRWGLPTGGSNQRPTEPNKTKIGKKYREGRGSRS